MKPRYLALASIVALATINGTAFAQGRDGRAWHGDGGARRGDGGGWHGDRGGWHGDRGGWHGDRGGWRGDDDEGGWRGGWYGPSIGLSFGIPGYWGSPYAYDYPYAYPYAYSDSYPVYAPPEPSVDIEEWAPAPQASGPAYWYYCTDPQGYYPYVQNCAKPWVQVLPQSVPGGQSAPAPSR